MGAVGLGKLNALAVALALATGTISVSGDAQAQAQAADIRRYDIPAGPLADGLKQLGLQSRLQLLAPPELTGGVRGRAVTGTYTAPEALNLLLAGSGLTYAFVNANTVVIKRAEAPAPTLQRPAASPVPAGSGKQPPAAAQPTELASVTVTGTRIRGGTTASPVIEIGSERIREEGFTDLGEVIRSVPQNFSGGQNPGVASGTASGAGLVNQNVTGGSGLNLRGLGPDATLTLLNGRRMAYGGFVQAVDISAIPVAAVDRVEIVTDGASAIYGSDAVGGVANVILKPDYDGTTVSTRYGAATSGGLASREYNLTTGTAWASGGLIATYKDESIDPVYVSDRDYTNYLPDPMTIYPGSKLRSGLLSAHQAIGESVELRLDALRTQRDQRYNYYGSSWTAYQQLRPKTKTSLLSPSIEVSLPGDWTLDVAATWAEDRHRQRQSQITRGTGASRVLYDDCSCNAMRTYEANAEGPVFSLKGGDARLAVGAGYRSNEYTQKSHLTNTTAIRGDEGSRFAYAEINVPLIGPDMGVTGASRLSLTAAIRGEDYDSFGSVTTPKLGVVYSPDTNWTFKGSWGKSFKAPTLFQRYWAQSAVLYPAAWLGGTAYPTGATVLLLGGGNPDLDAERARTWTASIAFHPETLPGLEAELSWFDIDYTNRVVQPINEYSQALSNPIYGQFLDYAPTAAEQQAVLAGAGAFYNITGKAYDTSKVVALLYANYVNVSAQRIKGLDLSGAYHFDLGPGRLTLRGSGSWLDSSQKTTAAQSAFDLAGTVFNPAKIKGRLGGVWNQGGVSASMFFNYASGVADRQRNLETSSFTTVDATLQYATGLRAGFWSGLDFTLSAQNLLNRAPPHYLPSSTGAFLPYDSTNYSAIGRFLSIAVAKHF